MEELRLLGHPKDKRMLLLGCRDVDAAVDLARQGAHVVVVTDDADELAAVRAAAEGAEVRIESHRGEFADLAFMRADTVDAALSIGALRHTADLDRVFRQVHRVLRTDAPLVFSVPHPAGEMVEPGAEPPLLVRRSYFDRSDGRRTLGDLFTAAARASFVVDTVLEPEPAIASPGAGGMVPRTLVLRIRKLGT